MIDINGLLNEQLENWPLAKKNYDALLHVKHRVFHWESFSVKLQLNPDRIRSAVAKVEKKEVKNQPCFLCAENRPKEQKDIPFQDDYTILINPFPIFPIHLTIPTHCEVPQSIKGRIKDMLNLAEVLPDFSILYNGPKSGASVPNHFHFQAGNKGLMPIEKELKTNDLKIIFQTEKEGSLAYLKNYLRKVILIESSYPSWIIRQFYQLYDLLHQIQPAEKEPMLNLIGWKEDKQWILAVFPRKQHRPHQFYATGTEQIIISPGVVDVGGMLITVREEDFEKINPSIIEDIYKQITLSDVDFEFLLAQMIKR